MFRVPTITPQRLRQLLRRFRTTRVLVVGDLMLDEFVWGKVSRISPEAPVPVVWVQSESLMPGGASNVANNIRALGGRVQLAGVVGTDRWGTILLDELASRRIGTGAIVRDRIRPTTVKTRVIAHHQQVVRVDREHHSFVPPAVIGRLAEAIRRQIASVDAVIIEDYGKGVITRALLEMLIPLARSHQRIITVDPKEEHFDLYQGVTAVTPNRTEAGRMVGYELETDAQLDAAGQDLVQRLRSEAVLVTLGEDGMCLYERAGRRTRIPTVAQEVFDVAGAGDTVIATFTLALAGGASMPEAAVVANAAAGIVVGKLGVATATPEELLAKNELPRRPAHTLSRIDKKPLHLRARQGSRQTRPHGERVHLDESMSK